MKNYIGFVNDHSGSMSYLSSAACNDYNANIKAIKDAASREMLDTVVSVAEVGGNARLSVTVSNPHVLHEKKDWKSSGGTPLWGGTLDLVNMLSKMPDSNKEDVSFLIMITTDGAATDPNYHQSLKQVMQPLLRTGRWTFVARVPSNISYSQKADLLALGIPEGNIQTWDTTDRGMEISTVATTQAMDQYFTARAVGSKSSTTFYANAAAVDTSALKELKEGKDYSLYVVPMADNGIEIRPFILQHRMEHLFGAAFYQLTKTESRVQPDKQVLIRDRSTGKVYSGQGARRMIGLPDNSNARLHPGDHKNYDIFIQSNSINRKLVGGTGVIYWKDNGRAFTEADLAYLKPKAQTAPAVVQLPAVPVSTKPTPSPIPVTKKPAPVLHPRFLTRDEAREHARKTGGKVVDWGKSYTHRWEVQPK